MRYFLCVVTILHIALHPGDAVANDDFAMTSPEAGEGTPSVIGGEPASPAEYPATFIFRTVDGGCTSTLIGQRAILTAAHCVKHNGSGTIEANGKKTKVVCEHHPDYGVNRTKDFALCLSEGELSGIPFENVNTSIAYGKVGDTARLLGFGCRSEGGFDKAFGVLFTGKAKITRTPDRDDVDTITQGGAAVCFGDSGGASYIDLSSDGGVRSVFAVNSRGDISTTSYLSTTATPSFVDFAVRWTKKNNAQICGVSIGAVGCR